MFDSIVCVGEHVSHECNKHRTPFDMHARWLTHFMECTQSCEIECSDLQNIMRYREYTVMCFTCQMHGHHLRDGKHNSQFAVTGASINWLTMMAVTGASINWHPVTAVTGAPTGSP